MYFLWQMVQENCGEETTNSRKPLRDGSESLGGDSHDVKDETAARKDFWSMQGDVVYRHHIEPRVQFFVPTETTFPIPLK